MSNDTNKYVQMYMTGVAKIAAQIDPESIVKMIEMLEKIRRSNGRLFILGVGGGAGNASHAVCDFRKIAGIEAYAVTDNISELTARVNDEGWETVFINWLKGSRLNDSDGVFVFSVGGGNSEKNISVNLIHSLNYAKEIGAKVLGIVGRDGGYTAKVADACIIIPTVNSETVTSHVESFQSVIWHLLVSHPAIKVNEMKWESVR